MANSVTGGIADASAAPSGRLQSHGLPQRLDFVSSTSLLRPGRGKTEYDEDTLIVGAGERCEVIGDGEQGRAKVGVEAENTDAHIWREGLSAPRCCAGNFGGPWQKDGSSRMPFFRCTLSWLKSRFMDSTCLSMSPITSESTSLPLGSACCDGEAGGDSGAHRVVATGLWT